MRVTRLTIKELFGITELELDGSSVELTGKNGAGKSSVIDAVRYALTNQSERDLVIRKGASEGEVIIETDTGHKIDRKKRDGKADYKRITENGKDINSPEAFLRELFTPMQLDPVAFIDMPRQEQNRMILDLIEFPWDLNWIQQQFGEIPTGVDYTQNILQVLEQIQSEKGDYFQARQEINRKIRHQLDFINQIAQDIPDGYQAGYWEQYDTATKHKQLAEMKQRNNVIERARLFKDQYDNKIRGLQAEREVVVSVASREISARDKELTAKIERLRAEIIASEKELEGLNAVLEDKIALAEAKYNEGVAKLDGDMNTAAVYATQELVDVTGLQDEIELAESMKKHLNEYKRMQNMQAEIEGLRVDAQELTNKIELARELPGIILKQADIPVEGLSVENGVPLINGMPVSNLSDGEKLSLCVDITISKPNALQLILVDGVERLSDANREMLYKKCKDKGLQFVATRTTNDEELEVVHL